MNNMASAKSRTLAQAVALSTSLTLMGKAEMKKAEEAGHGFRSVAPWAVEPVEPDAWMQLVSQNHPDGLRSYKMRDGRVVELVFSFE